jgi:hypothetical protein
MTPVPWGRLRYISVILISVIGACIGFRISDFGFGYSLAATVATSIEVSLAPDQPVPFVYVDDPLIVEFKSGTDTSISGHIEFTDDGGVTTRIEVPETSLRANGTHWMPLKSAPIEKGRYNTHVTLDASGETFETDLVFCRIDRPEDRIRPAVSVQVNAPDRLSLLALRGIPIRELHFDANLPNVAELAADAASVGYRVSLYADLSQTASAEAALETVSKLLGDRIAGWALDAGADVTAFDAAVAAIRLGGSRSPIAVVVENGSELAPYLENGAAHHIDAAMLNANDGVYPKFTEDARRAAEEAGYESFALHISGIGNGPTGGGAGSPLTCQLVETLATGAAHYEVDSAPLFQDETFGESFVELSALIRRLNGGAFVGPLNLGSSAHAAVFREGSRWTIAAWVEGEPMEKSIPIGAAVNIESADDCNNALAAPSIEEGAIRIALTAEPQYLSGEGGEVLAAAAQASALREAKGFVSDEAFRVGLPAEVVDLVETVAKSKEGRTDRLSFFGLLRMFPFLEQQWHEGQLARETAVPAMASIARLVRLLCILEQEANEPFIELLQETLARSGEYQSQYLTSAGGTENGHQRADWLSAEVSRLMAEAKTLAEQGREIEAVGVASLAEWRARSIEFAARAEPTNKPEPTGE